MKKVWKVYGRTFGNEACLIATLPTQEAAMKEKISWLKYRPWNYVQVWFDEAEISEEEFETLPPVDVDFDI